jgi:hypothetical protein
VSGLDAMVHECSERLAMREDERRRFEEAVPGHVDGLECQVSRRLSEAEATPTTICTTQEVRRVHY